MNESKVHVCVMRLMGLGVIFIDTEGQPLATAKMLEVHEENVIQPLSNSFCSLCHLFHLSRSTIIKVVAHYSFFP